MAGAELLTVERRSSALIVTLLGDITAANEEDFQQRIVAAAQEATGILIVDLSNIEFLSSSALGALMQLLSSMKKKDGRMALVGASDKVRRMFRITGIERLIPLMSSVEGALARLHRDAEPQS